MTAHPQPNLWTLLVRTGAPDTSVQAAQRLARSTALSDSCRDALRFIAEAGVHGATLDEWLTSTGRSSAHSGRFTQLARDGLIRDTGSRRPTRSGSMARVWVIQEQQS